VPRMRISLGLTTSTRWATARKWSRRYVPSSFRSLRRALSANRRRLSGVMAGPTRSSATAARSASACAWSRIADSSAIRSLSEGSAALMTPFSIAS
jgi:hypothetical protein